jgi:DNA primase
VPAISVEQKRAIKTANDIVDVISERIPVHPAGKIFKALCPFHDDTKPSLQIDRHYQNYRCWACDAKGDVFDFVMSFDKVEFPEALRILAIRAGIPLQDAASDPQAQAKSRLLETMRWAEERFRQCLLDDPLAESARNYLGSRKLSGSTVRQFGLGFAPLQPEWLIHRAISDNVPLERLVQIGLLGTRDNNQGYWERFRDRVMFPIRDARSQTVGFGGRILPDSPLAARGPKYYNSADTPLFNKSELLFGLDLARHAVSTMGCLVVVEGYTDVLMAHQCGFTHVVATMGTAFNERHLSQLRRYTQRVVLVFDADEGGLTGVDRALELFVGQDLELAVATLPDGLDPCDLLLSPGGVDRFRDSLAQAVDALEFKLNQLLAKGHDKSIDSVRRVVDATLGIMALAPTATNQANRVKQELMVTRLAHRLGLRQETVWARLGELRNERRRMVKDKSTRQTATLASTGATPKVAVAPPLERQLLEILLAEPALVPRAATQIPASELTHDSLRLMLTGLYELHASASPPDLDGLRVKLLEQGRDDLARKALELQFTGRHIPERPTWFERLVAEFARRRTDLQNKQLKERLTTCTNETEQLELLRQLQAGREPVAPGAA